MAVEGAARSGSPTDRIGKYEIISKIGQGAMGEVYKGRDTVLDRFVAIKTMSTAVLGNPEMGQRFLREAQSAARLNHPNVVTLHDFGEDAGRFFMAMELLEGEDLQHTLKRGVLGGLEDKLPVMEQILDGVAYAHAQGVIHRDLKPANIHVQKNGHIKVMDFGLARLGESEITRAGTVMGTPNYMSPEQVRGEKTGPASDVFALGAMFYEILSGRRAFDADSMHAVLYKVTESQPASLTEICEGIPPVIVTFVWRALAKAPELRYKDAGQMREALELCRRVLDGSLDEGSAIGAMGEAPTILQSPDEAAATAMWIDPGTPGAPTTPAQRRSTIRPGPVPSMRPASSPTIRRGAKPGSKPAIAPASTPQAAAPEVSAPSRTPLLLGIGAIAAVAVIALVVLLRQPDRPAPSPDDRQAKAVFSVAIEAQLDAARKSLEYKDPEGAISAAQKALQFDPGNAAAQEITNRARALLDGVEADAREARRAAEAGDLDGASRSLAKVLDVMPKHPVAAELSEKLASRFKARADDASKQMKQAAETARRAGASSLRAYADGANYASQGEAAYGRKQYTEAVQHFAEARRAYETAGRDATDLASKRAAAPVATKAAEPAPVTVAATPVSVPATPPPTPVAVAPAPTVATPPPATPPPAQKPVVDDQAALRQVVARLKEAIEQKDLSLYKRLRPDLKPDEERRLRDAFQNVTSQQVDFSVDSVSVDGDRATLKVTRSGRVSGQAVPSVRQVLKLTRTENGWVITEIGQ